MLEDSIKKILKHRIVECRLFIRHRPRVGGGGEGGDKTREGRGFNARRRLVSSPKFFFLQTPRCSVEARATTKPEAVFRTRSTILFIGPLPREFVHPYSGYGSNSQAEIKFRASVATLLLSRMRLARATFSLPRLCTRRVRRRRKPIRVPFASIDHRITPSSAFNNPTAEGNVSRVLFGRSIEASGKRGWGEARSAN